MTDATKPLPLRRYRVLDFGIFAAGPNGPRLLADFGADVIKVEPLTGDPFRSNVAAFRAVNRGKRSIAVDLKSAEGRSVVHRLIKTAHVVTHNMRPGVAERLGISFEETARVNPTIVYLHAPGWGVSGPKAHLQSFQPLFSGYAGIQWEAAGAGNPPVPTIGNEDIFNSNLGASAILMGLLKAAKSQEAQFVAGSQLASAMLATSEVIVGGDGKPRFTFEIDAMQTGRGPLHRQYQTADDWLTIVALTERAWTALIRAPGFEALSEDARFDDSTLRADHAEELSRALADILASMSAEQALNALNGAGVPCEISRPESLNPAYFWDDENEALGRVRSFDDETLGEVREIGETVRFSASDSTTGPRPTPVLGGDTVTILRELGYSESQVAELHASKVVRSPERADLAIAGSSRIRD